MPRGGERVGAGRKAQGITKKVSLTLTSDEWNKIENSELTVAAFLKRLIKMSESPQPIIKETRNINYSIKDAEHQWWIYEKYGTEEHSIDVIESAKASMMRNLFPKDSEVAIVETKPQYICPFTGKRFGSMESLVRSAIPILVSACESDIRRKKEETEREEANKKYKTI